MLGEILSALRSGDPVADQRLYDFGLRFTGAGAYCVAATKELSP